MPIRPGKDKFTRKQHVLYNREFLKNSKNILKKQSQSRVLFRSMFYTSLFGMTILLGFNSFKIFSYFFRGDAKSAANADEILESDNIKDTDKEESVMTGLSYKKE